MRFEAGNMAVVEDMTGIKSGVRKDKECITTTQSDVRLKWVWIEE
jgi:hypothetical protein